MFGLTSSFLFSRNKNTENVFSKKENVFLDLLKITSLALCFHFNEVLSFNENTQNEILLFSVFGSFEKL